MVGTYSASYLYNGISMSWSAPRRFGVYYCGQLNWQGQLVPFYIGRAAGEGVTIYSRLMEHLKNAGWTDVTHFCFVVCDTEAEAQTLEANEITRFQPKYNTNGKTFSSLLDFLATK